MIDSMEARFGLRRFDMVQRATQRLLPAVVLFLAVPITCLAEGDRGPLAQDFQMSLGWFFMNFDTDVRLDGQTTERGTDINWEDEFDFEDQDRFRIDGFWRFAEKHKLRFMYFENNRSNNKVLSRDIEFGDT